MKARKTSYEILASPCLLVAVLSSSHQPEGEDDDEKAPSHHHHDAASWKTWCRLGAALLSSCYPEKHALSSSHRVGAVSTSSSSKPKMRSLGDDLANSGAMTYETMNLLPQRHLVAVSSRSWLPWSVVSDEANGQRELSHHHLGAVYEEEPLSHRQHVGA